MHRTPVFFRVSIYRELMEGIVSYLQFQILNEYPVALIL
jgi:hypothetical protein